jgi:hypothetical protein
MFSETSMAILSSFAHNPGSHTRYSATTRMNIDRNCVFASATLPSRSGTKIATFGSVYAPCSGVAAWTAGSYVRTMTLIQQSALRGNVARMLKALT